MLLVLIQPLVDLQPGNIMLCTDEAQVWDELVQEEWADPSPRKVVKNRVIYASRSPDMPGDGRPTICDFGEAKVGPGPFLGEVMPDRYRALEIILYIPWTKQIDIWSMGLLVSSLWGLCINLIRTLNECSPVFADLGSSRRSASLQLPSNV